MSQNFIQQTQHFIQTLVNPQNAHPCRLTIRDPNVNAAQMYSETCEVFLQERSKFQKYCCAVGWGGCGLFFFIVLLAAKSPAGAFVLLLFCALFGSLFHFVFRERAYTFVGDDKDGGVSRARRIMVDKMNEDIKKEVLPYKSALEQLKQAPQAQPAPFGGMPLAPSGTAGGGPTIAASSGHPLQDCIEAIFSNFDMMNFAGTAPHEALATYSIAWKVLMDEYLSSSHPHASAIQDVHKKWNKLVVDSIQAGGKVADGMDNQRVRTRKRAGQQGIDAGVGAIVDLFATSNEIKELKENIESIRDDIKVLKQTYKDSTLALKDSSILQREGLHDVQKRRFVIFISFFTFFFFILFIVFCTLKRGWIALLMLVLMVFFNGVLGFMMHIQSQSCNALEDLYQLERSLRQVLATELDTHKMTGYEDLTAATNKLRHLVMEAYYDTLGIHLHTELLTWGACIPMNGDPVPYFWSKTTTPAVANNTTAAGTTSIVTTATGAAAAPSTITSSPATMPVPTTTTTRGTVGIAGNNASIGNTTMSPSPQEQAVTAPPAVVGSSKVINITDPVVESSQDIESGNPTADHVNTTVVAQPAQEPQVLEIEQTGSHDDDEWM